MLRPLRSCITPAPFLKGSLLPPHWSTLSSGSPASLPLPSCPGPQSQHLPLPKARHTPSMLSPCSDAFRMRLDSPRSLCRPRCFSCLRRKCHRPRAPRTNSTRKASRGPKIRASWSPHGSGGAGVAGGRETLRPSLPPPHLGQTVPHPPPALKSLGREGRGLGGGSRPTLERQGHVVVAQGAVAAVMVEDVSGPALAELWV